MQVGPSSNDDYLSIAWVAQVCCQLPLSWSIPAHVEEYLDNDKYDNNSAKKRTEKRGSEDGVASIEHKFLKLHLLFKDQKTETRRLHSHVPVQLHFLWVFSHWLEVLIVEEQLAEPWPKATAWPVNDKHPEQFPQRDNNNFIKSFSQMLQVKITFSSLGEAQINELPRLDWVHVLT